jgi:hypothetical protein
LPVQGQLLNQEDRTSTISAPNRYSVEVGFMFRKPEAGLSVDTRYLYNRVHDMIELATVRFAAPSPELFRGALPRISAIGSKRGSGASSSPGAGSSRVPHG